MQNRWKNLYSHCIGYDLKRFVTISKEKRFKLIKKRCQLFA